MMEGSTNLYLRYRVYYKAMTLKDLSPKALKPTSVRDRTMMYQVNLDKSTVKIPKQIIWSEVITGNQWNFDNITQLKPIKQDKPTFFIEDGQGNVQIHFDHIDQSLLLDMPGVGGMWILDQMF